MWSSRCSCCRSCTGVATRSCVSRTRLRALATLAEEGYVAQADAEALADAYRFLRRLEHRLQIVRDLQTHDLPADPHARTTLARSLGLADAAALQDEYERQTELVRGIHERLFYRPLLEAFAGPVAPSPGVDRPATEELLAGLGFASTSQSFEVLRRLVDPATRMGKVLAHVFPVMVPALALASESRPGAGAVGAHRRGGGGSPRPGGRAGRGSRRGAPAGARGGGQRVRDRPAGGVAGSADRAGGRRAGGRRAGVLDRGRGPLRLARAPTQGDGRRARRRRRPRDRRRGRGRRAGPAVRRHRHGQARRARAERGIGPGPGVRLRGRGRRTTCVARSVPRSG